MLKYDLRFNYINAHRILFFDELKRSKTVIRPTERKPQIIVSLTSIPGRLWMLHFVILSILRQTMLPDRIILWLSNDNCYRNAGRLTMSDLPEQLTRLQQRGLEIRWTKDTGPYRKLLGALKAFPDDIILTIDDDAMYRRDVVASLYNAYQKHGADNVYCLRSRIIKFQENANGVNYHTDEVNFTTKNNDKALFFNGVGGVLYPPHVLPEKVFDEHEFMKQARFEDDSWFNMMARLNGKRILQACNAKEVSLLPTHDRKSLSGETKAGDRKTVNKVLSGLITRYGIEL